MAEIAAVRPSLIVCLGATAAQSLLGAQFRVTKGRGKVLPGPEGYRVLVTVHPASILRLRSHEEREKEFESFVKDLRLIGRYLTSKGRSGT
jgi:DNA polymerase